MGFLLQQTVEVRSHLFGLGSPDSDGAIFRSFHVWSPHVSVCSKLEMAGYICWSLRPLNWWDPLRAFEKSLVQTIAMFNHRYAESSNSWKNLWVLVMICVDSCGASGATIKKPQHMSLQNRRQWCRGSVLIQMGMPESRGETKTRKQQTSIPLSVPRVLHNWFKWTGNIYSMPCCAIPELDQECLGRALFFHESLGPWSLVPLQLCWPSCSTVPSRTKTIEILLHGWI